VRSHVRSYWAVIAAQTAVSVISRGREGRWTLRALAARLGQQARTVRRLWRANTHALRTTLRAFADSNWGVTRSTTGYVVLLAGACILAASRRQHCITMSSCEAELVALADLAIEMLYIVDLLTFIGYEVKRPIKCFTDNKGAYDLCHRYTSAQNSRHIDRKLFKMRELRGAGVVSVAHVETKLNPADIFTKITDRQTFERHRATILGLAAARGAGREHREAVAAATSPAMLARVTMLADAIAAHYEPGPAAGGWGLRRDVAYGMAEPGKLHVAG